MHGFPAESLEDHQFQGARKEVAVFGFLYHAIIVHRKDYLEHSLVKVLPAWSLAIRQSDTSD